MWHLSFLMSYNNPTKLGKLLTFTGYLIASIMIRFGNPVE